MISLYVKENPEFDNVGSDTNC